MGSFKPRSQDLSGTKDAPFFLECEKKWWHISLLLWCVICPVQRMSTSTFRKRTRDKGCHITLNFGNRELEVELLFGGTLVCLSAFPSFRIYISSAAAQQLHSFKSRIPWVSVSASHKPPSLNPPVNQRSELETNHHL